LIVGGIFGETVPHFPLYLAEAACVEAAALVVSTNRVYTFGAVAGALVGTVGFAAEYAWSHVWMPVPWPQGLIAEAIVPVLVTAIAAGLLGGFIGGSFAAAGEGRRPAPPALAPAAAGLIAIVVAIGLNIGDQTPSGWSAQVSLDTVKGGPERTVNATIHIDPPQVAEDPYWLNAISWQGHGKLVLDDLRQIGPGTYRTTEPLPVYGTWKTLIRLHRDNILAGVPIYMPEDTAIPAKEIPAQANFTRPFVDETQILQREQKGDVPGFLVALAYSLVGAIVCALIALLGWVLVRVAREPSGDRPERGRRAAPTGAREVPA
jgi:hypothetical protein